MTKPRKKTYELTQYMIIEKDIEVVSHLFFFNTPIKTPLKKGVKFQKMVKF